MRFSVCNVSDVGLSTSSHIFFTKYNKVTQFKAGDFWSTSIFFLSEDFIHWPTLFLEVLSVDQWERFRTEGYGYVTLPNKAGEFFKIQTSQTCITWHQFQCLKCNINFVFHNFHSNTNLIFCSRFSRNDREHVETHRKWTGTQNASFLHRRFTGTWRRYLCKATGWKWRGMNLNLT